MSSRIPYGTAVTIDRLQLIERSERALRELGVSGDLRVRYHGDLARIEIASSALDSWFNAASRAGLNGVVRAAGFDRVAIDVRGFRSGSLNVLGGVVAEPLVRARSASGVGDATALEQAMRELGIACEIEARDRLALVHCETAEDVDRFADSALRSTVLEAARRQGFTHVAIELLTVGDDAAVHRD